MRQFYLFFSFSLFFSFWAAAQNTPNTISMVSGTNNATAFGAEGTIATSVTTFYTHWDATYLYLGWSEGRTNYSSDMYYVAIDTNPNSSLGCSDAIEGVSFTSTNSLPDFYIVFENNAAFYGLPATDGNAIEFYDGTSGAWTFVSRTGGNDNINSRIDFQDAPNGEVRLRIAWTDLNFIPSPSQPLGISYWTNNPTGDFMWSRFPNSNPGTGSTPIALTHQIVFNSTGNGINPSASYYENSFSDNTSYTSIADADWNTATTWQYNGIPISGGDINIDHDVISDVTASINSVNISESNSLTVNSGITLDVSDALTLQSSSNNYSSLIVDGILTGDVTYNRFVNSNANGNDLISPPVSGDTFGAFAGRNSNLFANPGDTNEKLFGPFDTGAVTPSYVNYVVGIDDAIVFTNGRGYRAGTNSGSPLTFVGAVEQNDVSTPIVNNGPGFSSWNLAGNPFPSYIRAKETYETNATKLQVSFRALYLYNASTGTANYPGATLTSSGKWIILGQTWLNANPNYGLAPGQGFFVKPINATDTFIFQEADRRIASDLDGTDDAINGRSTSSNNIALAKVVMLNQQEENQVDIYFTDSATRGLDPGQDIGGFGGSGAEFFTHLVEDNMGVEYAVQALPYADFNDIVISLGINIGAGEQISIGLDETFSTLPSGINVYLEDQQENTVTLLNSADFTLTPSTNLTGTGRFFLRFESNALSNPETSFESIIIYTREKDIVVSGNLISSSNVYVYDLQGRQVHNATLNEAQGEQSLDASQLSTGIYIVEVTSGSTKLTKKIILK